MKRTIIIGGGIAGLTTALQLKDRSAEIPGGLEVVVLEAGDRVGGNIRTDRVDGFRVEWGPNGYLDNVPATPALIERLGLEDQLQPADGSAEKRFLYRGGRLHRLPGGPISFLGCGVLSVGGRLRVMMEPFAGARPEGKDETVYEFASRRIGREAASVLVDAMVSGVFAGNVHELSLRSTFPKMAAMEAEHGGLVKAMLAKMRERRAARKAGATVGGGGPAGPGGTLTSFRDGLEVLTARLAEVLGESVRLRSRVAEIAHGDEDSGPWRVTTAAGESLAADAVVVALPAPRAIPMLESLDGELVETVARIPTASLAVVALGYRADELGGPPDGFGFLVPRGEGPRILGCLWDSSIFPGRAPGDRVLVRAMIGGAHDAEAVTLPDEALLDIVRRDLEATMGLNAEPVFERIYRHPLGIGQYLVGHQDLLDRIHRRLRARPGLWVAGSSYYGVSMNSCIEKAGRQVAEILGFLAPSG
ncbi:MAG: protoporphyrinogen oxidase [bacterium]|nr:protoporphyrinogen oxidase [bacterium]